MVSIIGLLAPLPFSILHGVSGDRLDPQPNFLFGKLGGCHPVGVSVATHMAHLVRSVLERADPEADEGSEQVISGHTIVSKLEQGLVKLLHLGLALLRLVPPVLFLGRRADLELRQPNQVYLRVTVLHVEPGLEPLLAGLEAFDQREGRTFPGRDCRSEERRVGKECRL